MLEPLLRVSVSRFDDPAMGADDVEFNRETHVARGNSGNRTTWLRMCVDKRPSVRRSAELQNRALARAWQFRQRGMLTLTNLLSHHHPILQFPSI